MYVRKISEICRAAIFSNFPHCKRICIFIANPIRDTCLGQWILTICKKLLVHTTHITLHGIVVVVINLLVDSCDEMCVPIDTRAFSSIYSDLRGNYLTAVIQLECMASRKNVRQACIVMGCNKTHLKLRITVVSLYVRRALARGRLCQIALASIMAIVQYCSRDCKNISLEEITLLLFAHIIMLAELYCVVVPFLSFSKFSKFLCQTCQTHTDQIL